jgi:hypothetical protein
MTLIAKKLTPKKLAAKKLMAVKGIKGVHDGDPSKETICQELKSTTANN